MHRKSQIRDMDTQATFNAGMCGIFFKNFSSVRFLNKTWIVWNEFGSVQFEKCGSVRIL